MPHHHVWPPHQSSKMLTHGLWEHHSSYRCHYSEPLDLDINDSYDLSACNYRETDHSCILLACGPTFHIVYNSWCCYCMAPYVRSDTSCSSLTCNPSYLGDHSFSSRIHTNPPISYFPDLPMVPSWTTWSFSIFRASSIILIGVAFDLTIYWYSYGNPSIYRRTIFSPVEQ